MEKVKAVRQRCKELNSEVTATASGKTPYVVISGRLMSRIKGKLEAVSDVPATKNDAIVKDNKRKNVKRGSQVAP